MTAGRSPARHAALNQLHRDVESCTRCPRLRTYCLDVAATKRRAFADQTYWGRPVPGFGDPAARIWIIGLAPAAHGANRTGRVFTGDRSGDFLFAALHRAGLANQPTSTHKHDGLALTGVYVSASARCAPPDNKPLPAELANCAQYLDREWALLTSVRVLLALGSIGFQACLAAAARHHLHPATPPRFAHAAEVQLIPTPAQKPPVHGGLERSPELVEGRSGGPRRSSPPAAPVPQPPPPLTLLASYHVSQQNTFTGKLTPTMFDAILTRCKSLAGLS